MSQIKAFRTISLIELAVAVVALAIVAALTVPRFSQAAEPAATPPLQVKLDLLRNAIERYCYDHVAWPGQKGDGTRAGGSPAAFIAQLTQYTDAEGIVSPVKTERFCYGPYLADGMPACPVGALSGANDVFVVNDDGPPRYEPSRSDAAWLFNCRTGTIVANTDAVDADGIRYDEY
ncbi:MAG: hypothetical protein JXO22_16735 [Phycisphaerae bacterium]|nr:hypothetical protein [Phycisphaerae bacterium]